MTTLLRFRRDDASPHQFRATATAACGFRVLAYAADAAG